MTERRYPCRFDIEPVKDEYAIICYLESGNTVERYEQAVRYPSFEMAELAHEKLMDKIQWDRNQKEMD